MAYFQDSQHVKQASIDAFKEVHNPGVPAPLAGVYRCVGCGHEIGIAHRHPLPPEPHAQHPQSLGAIRWQLLVFAVPNSP
jgi:hypothetical protein